MLGSALVRRFAPGCLRCSRLPSSVFSTDASRAATPLRSSPPLSTPPPPASLPHQQQQQQGTTTTAPVPPPHDASVFAPTGGPKAVEDLQREGSTRARGGNYEEEQACVLRAALGHVVRMKLGWSDTALIAGARDVGISPSIIGSFPRKEAALVEVITPLLCRITPYFLIDFFIGEWSLRVRKTLKSSDIEI
ncbi:hypothetical protein Taro_010691 [Colocasia esculenta]|uniref:Ubiquinone biosynthesis protein n=1 Tax=Colocasia esculenta TaxID=4460 RepID=A0A843U8F3_COLES|nr:hypothetical protein [Colocasia esculenta]